MRLRTTIGHALQRRFAPTDLSIISDDCWGGQYYRRFGIPYLTPTVGCWIEPPGYLDFIQLVQSGREIAAVPAESPAGYPVISAGATRFHFIHDADVDEVLRKFSRRTARLRPDQLFFKVDFGKYYSDREVEIWNSLRLPNSVALVPRGSKLLQGRTIHHAVEVDGWTIDGARMFSVSERHFDVVRWLRTGRISAPWHYRAFQRCFLQE
jgi:uncharacterized protein (DUF1919 family)